MRNIIAANWKMNTTLSEAIILANGVKAGVASLSGVDVVICPPSPWLVPVAEALQTHPVKHLSLGAQNIFWKESGAYTGEISAPMIKGLASYVILGHSERRKVFHESDQEISSKIKQALVCGIKPILCIGELRKPTTDILENPSDVTASQMKTLLAELEEDLEGMPQADAKHMVVAYEPVWAIGSGEAATGVYANHIMGLIRNHLAKHFGETGKHIPILYGGSANSDNAQEFLSQSEINGLLVGGASLKVDSFVAMCRVAQG